VTARVIALLSGRRVPLLAALVAVALTLPALGVGLLGDDYMHRSILLGVGDVARGSQPIFDLFAFVPQGARREATLSLGTLTWWAHPEISVALLRPLSAVTHVLDYALWPDAFWLQHLHSLLWFALATFAVAAFYRRVHGATAVTGLAAILFAVEDAHAMCAGWLANRHALISLVFGVSALHAHHRWRVHGGTRWAAIAVLLLAVALLCGEAALGAAAYILAWQLTMDDAPPRNRLAALLPYAVLVVTWRAAYDAFGYGTNGTALYLDPGRHPVEFLLALGERWPVLQLAQWFQVPVDLLLLLRRNVQIALAALAVALCLLIVRLFAPLVIARREARFWALGMCLALVPLCAAFPMDRLLLFSGVGAFALLAMLAEQAGLLGNNVAPSDQRTRPFVRGLLVLHAPIAAVLLVVRVATLPAFSGFFEAGIATAPSDGNAPRQTFVFVNGQEFPVVYLMILQQLESPSTAPRRVALLSSALSHNTVEREDADTLVITAREGFLSEPVDRLLRSLDVPFRAGEKIERRDFTAEVRTITADARPQQVAFHFRAPLESREYRWLSWSEQGVVDFALPPVGTTLELPAVSFQTALGVRRQDATGHEYR
jgi:hypothetical protein